MGDLVVTCPMHFWLEWIAEGDPAPCPSSQLEWGWYTSGRRPPIEAGDRLYVVAWGRLRGFAPVTRLRGVDHARGIFVDARELPRGSDQWCICRRGDAQAVTVPWTLPGFRGWRKRWWPRGDEIDFREWQTESVGIKRRRAA